MPIGTCACGRVRKLSATGLCHACCERLRRNNPETRKQVNSQRRASYHKQVAAEPAAVREKAVRKYRDIREDPERWAARLAAQRTAAKKAGHRERSAPKERAARLRRLYGLPEAAYEARLAAQGGACAICRTRPELAGRLHVDHDHGTGKVRGLLFGKCNKALGLLGDTANGVRPALDYLERAATCMVRAEGLEPSSTDSKSVLSPGSLE